jgi:hypothetical protein
VTCWCYDINADVSNAFDVCICIAKADDLILYWPVLSEARPVITYVCVCTVVETKVAIVLITLCSAQCVSRSGERSSRPSLLCTCYSDGTGLACRFLGLFVCVTAGPEVGQCDLAAREGPFNLLALAMTPCNSCNYF